MAEIPVNFLLEKLHAFLGYEAQFLGSIRQEVEEIREELEMIEAFLKDADRKREKSKVIETWVKQVRRIAYDMEDVIDEFILRFGRRDAGDGIKDFFSTLFTAMKQPLASHDLANRIRGIKRRMKSTSDRKDKLDIQSSTEEDNNLVNFTRRWQGREEATFLGEADVVGIQEGVNLLTEKLVGMTGEDRETYPTFVSVVGMGGSGKTTLVRKVYKNVEARFDCSAWVSISQSFTTKDLLKTMLTDFCEGNEREPLSKEDIDKKNEEGLKKKIKKYLEGKKFILVLDDVWERGVWDCLKLVLPKDYSGSKIMITTRNRSVASALETPNFIHELKALSEDVAMTLLCRKALPRNSTLPSEFEDVCKSMLQRCGGLPLAIAALGGILCKKKSLSEWNKVNDNLRYRLANDCAPSDSITRILKLSYDDLPFHLKPCFLYCGLFPEDHLIRRNKLIRLWVAEGFIKESGGKRTMEDVGEEYMMQLIDRSMLQIGDISRKDGSRVKSCKIHDLMRDVAISISQEEEFAFKHDQKNENVMKGRRMCVVGQNDEEISINNHHMRSLRFFDVGYMKRRDLISSLGRFRLLRVLDLEDGGINKLPEQITRLLHLRYLSLRNNRGLKELPGSIGRLINLQTLDIRATGIDKLPNGIVRLRNLRHLCMDKFKHISVPRGIGNLRCLQTLTGMKVSGKGIGGEIGKLKELRRLEIRDLLNEEAAEEVYASIRSMTHLFSLLIYSLTSHKVLEHPPPNLRILNLRGFSNWPVTLGSLDNLISLNLSVGRLTHDPFPSLSSLPSLLRLQLSGLNYIKQLQCGAQGFPNLQSLVLRSMEGLETVRWEEGSMPSLKELYIEKCYKLQMVPQGIEHLQLLQKLLIRDMPEEFIERLKEGGEDRPKVRHIPLVTHSYWDDENHGFVTEVLSQ